MSDVVQEGRRFGAAIGLRDAALDGRLMLSVWAMLNGKHAKVLNIEWFGDKVQVVSFRRGEWESELLTMGRAAGFPVH
jgi:hypothetical protein